MRRGAWLSVLFVFFAACALSGCATQLANTVPEMPNPNTATATDITFNNLEANCTIRIYDLTGELVRTIAVSNGNGQAGWDLKNDQGDAVLSGTYEYTITGSTEQMKGKVVIIR